MEDILSDLNLSESAQKIFGITLIKGTLTAESISSFLDLDLKAVKRGLKELSNKNLVKQVSGVIPRYISLPPIESFIQYLGTYKNSMDKSIKKIQEINESKIKDYDKTSQKFISNVIKDLDEAVKSIKERKLQINEDLESTKNSTDETLSTSNKTFMKDYKNSLKVMTSSLKTDFEKEKQELINITENQKISFNETLENFPDDLEKNYQKILGGTRDSLKNLNSLTDKTTDVYLSDTKQNLNEHLLKITADIESFGKKNKQFMQDNKIEINNFLKDSKTQISNIMNDSMTFTQNTITSIKTETSSALNKYLESHQSTSDGFVVDLSQLFSELNISLGEVLQKLQSDLVNQTEYQYKEAKRSLQDRQIELQGILTESYESTALELTKLIEKINTDVSEALDTVNKQISDGETALTHSIQQKLAHQTTNFNDIMDNFLQDFKRMSVAVEMELKQEISDHIENSKSDVEESLEEFKTSINSAKNAVNSLFLLKKDENINVMKENIKIIEKEYSTFDGVLKSYTSTVINGSTDQITEALNNTEQNAKDLVNTFKQNLNQVIKETDEIIEEKGIEAIDVIKNKVTGAIEESDTKIEEINGLISENFSSQQNISEKTISESIAKITDIQSNIIDNFGVYTETLKSKFHNIIDQQISGLNEFKEESSTLLVAKTAEYKNILFNAIDRIKSEFETISTSKDDEFDQSVNEILKKHLNRVKEITNTLSETYTTVNIDLKSLITDFEEVILSTAVKIKENAKKSAKLRKQTLNKELKKIFADSLKIIKNLKSISDKPIKIFESAWETINSVDMLKTEETWHIIGEEGIYDHIKNMIGNAKKKIIIGIPEIENLPFTEDLLSSKKAGITVITSLTDGSNNEIVEKLRNKGAEIINYQEGNLIVAIRDNEELLLAPFSRESKNLTAILSENAEIVRVLGSIIEDHFRKNAVQLNLEDEPSD